MATFLDWSKGTVGEPAPCVICGKPAIMRSPKGKPCHKGCAERWIDQHGSQSQNEAPRLT